MFKKKLLTVAAITSLSIFTFTACSTTNEPDTIDEGINVYSNFIDDVFNHTVETEELQEVSNDATQLQLDNPDNPEKVLEYFENIDWLKTDLVAATELPDEEAEVKELIVNFRVLGFMSFNTLPDNVSVEIDKEKVSITETGLDINREGIVFSSAKNSETKFADLLNENIGYQSEKTDPVILIKNGDSYLVDLQSTNF